MNELSPAQKRFFLLLCRHQWLCSNEMYYRLLERAGGIEKGWRPLSMRQKADR